MSELPYAGADPDRMNVHEIVREGMEAIKRNRGQATEYDLIKGRLGLPPSATFREVADLIDGLIEVAEMYEGLCK